ncbi:hypothetical protein XI08_09520, partial [Bradyrhizobium sp. CCBAU 11361]|nr:hypothetical protein [Bradyrhizobium sp. CCBAU 11361]
MMKAAPAASLEVAEPDLLLEFLIVAFDATAQFSHLNESPECHILRQCREPVFGRLVLAFWPFDQQPFLQSPGGLPIITMRGTDPHACKARGQLFARSLP